MLLGVQFLIVSPVPADAAQISSKQAKEIVHELKQIRRLLESRPLSPPAAPSTAGTPTPGVAVPEMVTLKLGTEIALGRDDSPVTIVEFNDLQCPFCSRFHADAFPEIKRQFIDTGKVRFINRDLPLDELHPQATRAAQAARCAGEQGKYWEAAGNIISNNGALTAGSVDQLVGTTGVDGVVYRSCMESGRHLNLIRENAAGARAMGITGTPSFVVGRVDGDVLRGEKMVGALPFSAFDAAIRKALAP